MKHLHSICNHVTSIGDTDTDTLSIPKRKGRIFTRPIRIASTIILATMSSCASVNGFSTRIESNPLISASNFNNAGLISRRHDCRLNRDVLIQKSLRLNNRECLLLGMTKRGGGGYNGKDKGRDNDEWPNGKPNKRRSKNRRSKQPDNGFSPVSRVKMQKTAELKDKTDREEELLQRITQLESLVASQAVEMRKLRQECDKLKDSAEAFGEVVNLLRQAGLSMEEQRGNISNDKAAPESGVDGADIPKNSLGTENKKEIKAYEAFDDSDIFGTAPSTVNDAADAAGASILAAILGGKQRMLVDVRDAELSRDPDVLVQFIELLILPVAAGLEGLKTKKNRVKIIFPTVSRLMQYRRTMALAAPEVISLSTLGFDPVEEEDNLVVVVAPSPDDLEGLAQMNDLLTSPDLRQPVVVLNHHMVPLQGPGSDFDPIYHLRLLSVQYMTGGSSPPEWGKKANAKKGKNSSKSDSSLSDFGPDVNDVINGDVHDEDLENDEDSVEGIKEDAELEAAMEHAHELGVHQGMTRAMVIRAYPRPWHIFVDTSPDSDADFEVAATFDECPSQDDVNYAIVECLEGSEREDELVAQQMQEALESGQLNAVSDMLGIPHIDIDMDVGLNAENEDDDDEDVEGDDWDPWGTDTV